MSTKDIDLLVFDQKAIKIVIKADSFQAVQYSTTMVTSVINSNSKTKPGLTCAFYAPFKIYEIIPYKYRGLALQC